MYVNDLPDDVICNIAIYADNTTFYSRCYQASDLCKQLELASELESDLQHNVDWGRTQLVDFIASKAQIVLFDQFNNSGATDVKMDGPVFYEKSSFKMLRLSFCSKFDCGSFIVRFFKCMSWHNAVVLITGKAIFS